MTTLPAWGEVWWCDWPDIGSRPVVVLSRDAAIPRLRRTLVARPPRRCADCRARSSSSRHGPGSAPVGRFNLDSVESISIAVLVRRLGRLGDDRMAQVCAALGVAVDCGR